jgi:hypothetical protein
MRVTHGVGALALVAFAAVVSPLPAQQAPDPADSGVTMSGGPVMRVSFFKVNTGMGQENQRDLRQHLVPIWEAEKAAGIILGYTVVTNLTTDTPDDWTVAFALTYPNFAALDSLGARTGPITLKHYGSAEARTAAGNRRDQLRTLVRSSLMRVVNITRTQRP